LGIPDSNARNVTVSFTDYIKNVASSEIFPTWPEDALRANIHAQVGFVLNRVFTEWYPSRGYNFNITNTTSYDQAFVEGRNIYGNISELVDEIFNDIPDAREGLSLCLHRIATAAQPPATGCPMGHRDAGGSRIYAA
jgi:hypothetical protein